MSEQSKPTVAISERILDLLQAEGIETLWGIPDPGVQTLFHAANRRGMKVVTGHHESAQAFMADAEARMTGRPTIVSGNQGPGVANLLPAAVSASKEKVPVVFLAEQRSRFLDKQVRRAKFQYTDQPRFFEPAMKYVGIIEHAGQTEDILREAFRQAMTGTPGPVYIEYPQDHVNAQIEDKPVLAPEAYRVVSQKAEPSAIEAAVELLVGAQFPIILAGTGIHMARGHEEFQQLAEALQCPVIPSWGGRGVLSDTHNQVMPWGTEISDEAIKAADVVLAIGTGIGEPLKFGRGGIWGPGDADRKWIYIEKDVLNIGVNRHIDVPLVGNLKDICPQLTAALAPRKTFERPQLLSDLIDLMVAFRQGIIDEAPDTYPVHPGRMIVEATRESPDDLIMVRDGGCTCLWEGMYHIFEGRDYLANSNFGHLGVGLPYAIGAAVATKSKRPVLLITGDSAFGFHTSELETAVRLGLPIVCVVNSDSAWGMEHIGFRVQFGEGNDVGVKWGNVRYDKVAEGFGAHGEYCERTEEIAPAMARAWAAGKPAVVHVAVDAKANAEPPYWEQFASAYNNYY
jgi:acetolactate synthase I/II/III large subunit